ncbi:Sec-independent protein translocase protein TatB [Thiomicrospira sp. S5]|uniref:Sec-independent protein translocase protein TatB n=1 Tax=Thiomicrospira sp. S5 TaxID=1803865 RepID=UPI000F89F31B|nr:Sec-independent protein translocase protein TatB [Thiomicrospira sp. S5]AZR81220.1 preprotein translocase subunit TatB [Thiomicrospira sp. S5]
MFDIGFLEIIVILVITLIVIGPERMPEVARKIGQFVGKTKRFINSVKDNSEISETVRELQHSINLEEERKQIESVSHSLQDDLTNMQDEFGIDELSRPFGNDPNQPAEGSQFNKAPAQPVLPGSQDDKAQPDDKTENANASEESSEKPATQTADTHSVETNKTS